MDLVLLILGLGFLAVLAGGFFFFLKEKPSGTPASKTEKRTAGSAADLQEILARKTARYEEKIQQMDEELRAVRKEIEKSQEREQNLIKEKNNIAFDTSSLERLKKEQAELKEELKSKEETLEEVISARRRENGELIQLRQDHELLKKKLSETEDAERKSQAVVENLSKENKSLKETLQQQKKIVDEHNVNKTEGEWVSREEFDRLQAVLKEKESQIQKFKNFTS